MKTFDRKVRFIKQLSPFVAALFIVGCGSDDQAIVESAEMANTNMPEPVMATTGLLNEAMTQAQTPDGQYISWREHRIDDELLTGVELRGSDGLVMADIDGDGYQDIVSVHESDDFYDGAPEGHIRIAFGTEDPDQWVNVTLAEGPEAGAAEDAVIVDINGDGLLDIVAACELSHLIYFENPGSNVRSGDWDRLIPSITQNRGSFIRVFAEDFNGDGIPDLVSPNKGSQDPTQAIVEPKEISIFTIANGEGLNDAAWSEHVLTRVPWPINSQPVDMDADGDMDVVAASVAEERSMWFENVSQNGELEFIEHPMTISEPGTTGDAPIVNVFNMDVSDLNNDGRVDIVTFDTARLLGIDAAWIEQPASPEDPWILHRIGSYAPDQLVGLGVADIDGDGDDDVITGGYSGEWFHTEDNTRLQDGLADPESETGRLAWFENQGNGINWIKHDFSRRERGMFDKFIPLDVDNDGDLDFFSTRGNSGEYDGVLWLEQLRTNEPVQAFISGHEVDSPEIPLPL